MSSLTAKASRANPWSAWLVGACCTVAFAVPPCVRLMGKECTYSGSPSCSMYASVQVCDSAAGGAVEVGEAGKRSSITTTLPRQCRTISGGTSADWWSGPCTQHPTGSGWVPLPATSSCRVSGACCWYRISSAPGEGVTVSAWTSVGMTEQPMGDECIGGVGQGPELPPV